MDDFLNSLTNSLYNSLSTLDNALHKTDIKDTAVDNFIHELKDYLFKSDCQYQLSKLSSDTYLDINEFYDNCVQCYVGNDEYLVPNEMVCSEELENTINHGDIKLQLQDDGLYHIINFSQ